MTLIIMIITEYKKNIMKVFSKKVLPIRKTAINL